MQREGEEDRRQRLLATTAKGRALALDLARSCNLQRIAAALRRSWTRQRRSRRTTSLCARRSSRRAAGGGSGLRRDGPWRIDEPTADVGLPDDAPHLLVVDDDNRIRTLLHAFWPSMAFASPRPRTPPSARAKSQALAFDLLILDVMMPGENGFELTAGTPRDSERADPDADGAGPSPTTASGGSRSAPTTISPSRSSRANCCCASTTSSSARRARGQPEPTRESVRFGPFTFHVARGELQRDGETIRITERERDMLRMFADAPGETVDRARLAGDGRRRQRAHGRRPDQPAAPQDRARSRPTRSIFRRCAASAIGWPSIHDARQPRRQADAAPSRESGAQAIMRNCAGHRAWPGGRCADRRPACRRASMPARCSSSSRRSSSCRRSSPMSSWSSTGRA